MDSFLTEYQLTFSRSSITFIVPDSSRTQHVSNRFSSNQCNQESAARAELRTKPASKYSELLERMDQQEKDDLLYQLFSSGGSTQDRSQAISFVSTSRSANSGYYPERQAKSGQTRRRPRVEHIEQTEAHFSVQRPIPKHREMDMRNFQSALENSILDMYQKKQDQDEVGSNYSDEATSFAIETSKRDYNEVLLQEALERKVIEAATRESAALYSPDMLEQELINRVAQESLAISSPHVYEKELLEKATRESLVCFTSQISEEELIEKATCESLVCSNQEEELIAKVTRESIVSCAQVSEEEQIEKAMRDSLVCSNQEEELIAKISRESLAYSNRPSMSSEEIFEDANRESFAYSNGNSESGLTKQDSSLSQDDNAMNMAIQESLVFPSKNSEEGVMALAREESLTENIQAIEPDKKLPALVEQPTSQNDFGNEVPETIWQASLFEVASQDRKLTTQESSVFNKTMHSTGSIGSYDESLTEKTTEIRSSRPRTEMSAATTDGCHGVHPSSLFSSMMLPDNTLATQSDKKLPALIEQPTSKYESACAVPKNIWQESLDDDSSLDRRLTAQESSDFNMRHHRTGSIGGYGETLTEKTSKIRSPQLQKEMSAATTNDRPTVHQSSLSRNMTQSSREVKNKLFVEDAGISIANGMYRRCKDPRNGRFLYTKDIEWNGLNATSNIFLSPDHRDWMLSISPGSFQAGAELDVNLYSTECLRWNEEWPSSSSPWVACSRFGHNPPPTVTAVSAITSLTDHDITSSYDLDESTAFRSDSDYLHIAYGEFSHTTKGSLERFGSNNSFKEATNSHCSINHIREDTRDRTTAPSSTINVSISQNMPQVTTSQLSQCAQCCLQSSTHIFKPCGHSGLCEGCVGENRNANYSMRCSVCRSSVRSVVRVYDTPMPQVEGRVIEHSTATRYPPNFSS